MAGVVFGVAAAGSHWLGCGEPLVGPRCFPERRQPQRCNDACEHRYPEYKVDDQITPSRYLHVVHIVKSPRAGEAHSGFLNPKIVRFTGKQHPLVSYRREVYSAGRFFCAPSFSLSSRILAASIRYLCEVSVALRCSGPLPITTVSAPTTPGAEIPMGCA